MLSLQDASRNFAKNVIHVPAFDGGFFFRYYPLINAIDVTALKKYEIHSHLDLLF